MPKSPKVETENYFGTALQHHINTGPDDLVKQLAVTTGLSDQQINRIARGKSHGSVGSRLAICEFLATSHEQMLALGRRILEGEDVGALPARKDAPARRGVLLSPRVMDWWPDLEHYVEILNLAARSDDCQLMLTIVETMFQKAIKHIKARCGADASTEGSGQDGAKRADNENRQAISEKGYGAGDQISETTKVPYSEDLDASAAC